MKKTILPIATVATVVGAVAFGAVAVSAHGAQSNGEYQQALADKLNVDVSQVETAMEELREERQAERQAEVEAQINQAVGDEKLTQSQADELLALLAEQRTAMHELSEQGLSREDFREQRKAAREAVKNWAEDNGVSLSDFIEKPDHAGEGRRFAGRH